MCFAILPLSWVKERGFLLGFGFWLLRFGVQGLWFRLGDLLTSLGLRILLLGDASKAQGLNVEFIGILVDGRLRTNMSRLASCYMVTPA